MNEVIVTIQGRGTYIIPADKVGQLILWLQSNQAVGVNEGKTSMGGEQLLRG